MHWIRTLIIHALIAAAIFSPALQQHRILAPDDGVDYFVPAILSKDPIWNPDLMCGFPAHADSQTMLWYPLRLVVRGVESWNWFVLAAFVLMGASMHRWIARIVKSETAGLAGGACGAYAGFFVAHLRHPNILHTMAWIPLVLLGIEHLRIRPSRRRIAATSLAAAAAILAGHPQILAYLALVTMAYALVIGGPKTAAASVAVWVLGAAIAGALLLPFADWAARSVRSTIDPAETFRFSITPEDLSRMFVSPMFRGEESSPEAKGTVAETTAFLGVIGFVLALFAVARGENRERFFGVLALAAVLFAFGPATPWGRSIADLPGFDRFRAPGRHLAEFHLAVAALAGFGIAQIQRRSSWLAGPVLVLFMAELASFALYSEWRFRVITRQDFERPAFLDPFREELLQSGQRIAPFMGTRGAKETSPPNRSALWEIPSTSGYNPLRSEDIARMLQLDLRAQFSWDLVTGPHRGLDLAAARYLTVKDSPTQYVEVISAQSRWKRTASTAGAVVFENLSAMPRAWLTSEIAVLPRQDILHTIETALLPAGQTFDPRRTALVEELLPYGEAGRKTETKEDSVTLELNRGRIVRMRTRSPEARMLVMSDAFDAGWKARVDGRAARLQRCDYMFLGIPLGPGAHVVELTYRPPLLILGAAISILALLAVGAMLLIPVRHPPKSTNPPVTIAE